MRRLVADAGVRAWAVDRLPGHTRPARAQRIAIYKSWMAPIDEGWTRWVLEQYGFTYSSITNADVAGGALRSRFDVIVLPHQTPRGIIDGYRTDDRPSTPGPYNPPPPEYQGGIGEEGVASLRRFVMDGGTLVTLDAASDLPLARFGGVFDRIDDVTVSLPRTRFYCPGSVLRLDVDVAAPMAWGMDTAAAAVFDDSRAFATTDPSVRRVARYGPADSVLMSGWLLGAPVIGGRDAVLDVPFGRGRVVLFGFRPQFRAQPHGTFKLLFNALF